VESKIRDFVDPTKDGHQCHSEFPHSDLLEAECMLRSIDE
jgi:hypothetical protein